MRYIYSLLLLLLAAPSLFAEVRLTELSSPKVLDQPGETIPIDIDNNGSADLNFYYDLYQGKPYLHINIPGNVSGANAVVVTGQKNIYSKDYVAEIPDGNSIGSSSRFNGPSLGNGPLVAQPQVTGPDILEGRGEVYIGVKFSGMSGIHYGWLAIDVNSFGDEASIIAYAWETEATTPITAGAGRVVPVSSIDVYPQSGSTIINQRGGTLQLLADVNPSNATTTDLLWSVDRPDIASIDSSGLLTALADGTVLVTVAATDGSDVEESIEITITGQSVHVTAISVMGESGTATITEAMGMLQMIAEITPENATTTDVLWSVTPEGIATIDSTGRLTARANGEVIVTAAATDGSGVSGSAMVTVSGQPVQVASITIRGESGVTTITEDHGTLQLTAEIAPNDASQKDVTWSVDDSTMATISSDGLLTARRNGQVTVMANATDGSGVIGSLIVEITGQLTMSVKERETYLPGMMDLR